MCNTSLNDRDRFAKISHCASIYQQPEAGTIKDNKFHILNFLRALLDDPLVRFYSYIRWEDRGNGIFKILDPYVVAKLWGNKKNLPNMNYDKMSRALRYYYKAKVLSKCGRLCYRFNWDKVNPPPFVKLELSIDGKHEIQQLSEKL